MDNEPAETTYGQDLSPSNWSVRAYAITLVLLIPFVFLSWINSMTPFSLAMLNGTLMGGTKLRPSRQDLPAIGLILLISLLSLPLSYVFPAQFPYWFIGPLATIGLGVLLALSDSICSYLGRNITLFENKS